MKKIKNLFIILFLFVTNFSLIGQMAIDSTFGIGGKVRFNFPELKSILPLEDGKILISENNIVTRLTKNGQIDESFGENGEVEITNDGIPLAVKGLLLHDSKLLIFAQRNNVYVLIFASINGNNIEQIIDLSFDFTKFHFTNIHLHNDKLLVMGGIKNEETGINEYALIRFLLSGEIDSSFGENGLVITNFETLGGILYRCVIDNDNMITLLGHGETDVIVQLNDEGVLNATFGDGGVVHFKNGYFGHINQFHLVKDNKILLTGTTRGNEDAILVHSIVLYRLNSDGSFDETFGEKGKISEGFKVSGLAPDLPRTHSSNSFIQEDGKIILIGRDEGSINDPNEDRHHVLAVRFFPNGEIDNTFGINGKLIIPHFKEANSHFAYQEEDYFIFTVSLWGNAEREHYIIKIKENDISTSSLVIPTNSFLKAQLMPNITQNYSTLQYILENTQEIKIQIIGLQGRFIENLKHIRQNVGKHELSFSVNHLPKGFYIIRVKGNHQQLSLPLIKL